MPVGVRRGRLGVGDDVVAGGPSRQQRQHAEGTRGTSPAAAHGEPPEGSFGAAPALPAPPVPVLLPPLPAPPAAAGGAPSDSTCVGTWLIPVSGASAESSSAGVLPPRHTSTVAPGSGRPSPSTSEWINGQSRERCSGYSHH